MRCQPQTCFLRFRCFLSAAIRCAASLPRQPLLPAAEKNSQVSPLKARERAVCLFAFALSRFFLATPASYGSRFFAAAPAPLLRRLPQFSSFSELPSRQPRLQRLHDRDTGAPTSSRSFCFPEDIISSIALHDIYWCFAGIAIYSRQSFQYCR